MTGVHPTAVVRPGAQLGEGTSVDPYAVIGAQVRIVSGCRVGSHAVIEGHTTIEAGTEIGPHAVVGGPPQLRNVDAAGVLVIGRDNRLREFVTVHAGSPGSSTVIGRGNLLMAYAHVAHDCRLGDEIELANGVQLGGHVEVGDKAVVGGLVGVHQYGRIGCGAMVAAGAMVAQDVLPWSLVAGNRARTLGVNTVGLKRAGYDAALRGRIAAALRVLQQAATLAEGLEALSRLPVQDQQTELLRRFVESSSRGFCRPAADLGGVISDEAQDG